MFVIKNNISNSNIGRTIRFNESLYEALCRVAQRENISVNSLVIQCCEYALGQMKPDTDNT